MFSNRFYHYLLGILIDLTLKWVLFGFLVTSCWSELTEKSYKSVITVNNLSEHSVEVSLSFDSSTQFACDDYNAKKVIVQPKSKDIVARMTNLIHVRYIDQKYHNL